MKNDNFIIRPANLNDLQDITNLSAQLGYPSDLEDVKKRLNVILQKKDQAVFVAEDQQLKHIFGWVHILTVLYLESDLFAEIGGLVVDEHKRGYGLGKQLMQTAETWAVEQGITSIRLRSNTKREGAHKFYERIGYKKVKSQFTFYKLLI